MRVILAFALAIAACGTTSRAEEQSAIRGDGRAIDGDTVSFDVRLFGADAFEKRQMCRAVNGCWPCGKAAQDYASRILKSGTSTIRLTGKQSYGRPIGTVEVNGQDLGASMIAAGLALPAIGYLKDDPARAQRYMAAYERAKATRTGAHDGYFIDPATWRRGERLSCEGRPRGN